MTSKRNKTDITSFLIEENRKKRRNLYGRVGVGVGCRESAWLRLWLLIQRRSVERKPIVFSDWRLRKKWEAKRNWFHWKAEVGKGKGKKKREEKWRGDREKEEGNSNENRKSKREYNWIIKIMGEIEEYWSNKRRKEKVRMRMWRRGYLGRRWSRPSPSTTKIIRNSSQHEELQ